VAGGAGRVGERDGRQDVPQTRGRGDQNAHDWFSLPVPTI
jgi:hypothetical protein